MSDSQNNIMGTLKDKNVYQKIESDAELYNKELRREVQN